MFFIPLDCFLNSGVRQDEFMTDTLHIQMGRLGLARSFEKSH